MYIDSMICKNLTEETEGMTHNSFSMNTILTNETQQELEEKTEYNQQQQEQQQLEPQPLTTQTHEQQDPTLLHEQQQLLHEQHSLQQQQQHSHTQQQQQAQQQPNTQQQQPQQQQVEQQPSSSSGEEVLRMIEDEKPRKEELSSEARHVHVTLEESELWKKFKTLTNEMIVTKNGRFVYFHFILYTFNQIIISLKMLSNIIIRNRYRLTITVIYIVDALISMDPGILPFAFDRT